MSDEDALIRRLSTLAPTSCVDPVAIAFEAGRRSARASLIRWRAATMLAVAVVTWLALPSTRPDGIAALPTAPEAITSPPAPRDNVIALRDAVLSRGLDGLPAPPTPTATPSRPISIRELLGGES